MTTVEEEPAGPQGYSGSQVRYYAVSSRDAQNETHHDRLVVKHASQLERRIVHHLRQQGVAVPPVVVADVDDPERAPLYMPYLDARPPFSEGFGSPMTASIADGLAAIHAANRMKPPPWLPHVSENFERRLWLYSWREKWEENLALPGFSEEFGAFTAPLETAHERLLRHLAALTAEATSLTLLNVDLIPDHIRLWQGSACFIDWEQAGYGSLYLDLPNAFTIETALTYRDALARHGYDIPEVEFMERFHEVSRYMGLRYLGFSLWQWAQGGAERERGRWFLHYTLSLGRYGR